MTNDDRRAIINLAFAGVAHLVERDLAKVEVASSSLVARSKKQDTHLGVLFFCQEGRGSNRPVPAIAGISTVRGTVEKVVCVSAAIAVTCKNRGYMI